MNGGFCQQSPFPARRLHLHFDPTMKIAQIAPLAESVPPRLYGGTERVVSYLTEELVGSGTTSPCSRAAIRRPRRGWSPARRARCASTRRRSAAHHLLMLERVRQRADEFDVLHFHIEHLHLPLFRRLRART